ncbi:Alpha/beta hydrolase fold-1 [Xylariales sp. PMI_506]|nr:Alpha/beta hydrolase fold-1 [Xylariales sp. PMI_506]
MANEDKPTAVLVITGAWHIPEHYSKMTSRLEAQELRVICPRLPTNNNAYPPNKFLEDDVAFIQDLISTEVASGTRLAVVGHSWGGMLATATIADFAMKQGSSEVPQKGGVTNIIYMAAFIPYEDESLAGIFGGSLPPYLVPHDDDGTLRWVGPIDHLYNDLPEDEAKRMEDLRVWHSSKAQFTPISCKRAAWRVVPVTYLYAEADNALPLGVQEMMVGRLKKEGIHVDEIKLSGGHSLFISCPDEVVESIMKVIT